MQVRDLRKKAGLSQKKLGEIVGVTQGTISQWEKKLTHPRFKTARKLAKALNVSVNDLLEDDEPEEV